MQALRGVFSPPNRRSATRGPECVFLPPWLILDASTGKHGRKSTHHFVPDPEHPRECSICGRRESAHEAGSVAWRLVGFVALIVWFWATFEMIR